MTTYEPADWRPEPGDLAEVTWEGETARRVLTDTGAWWSRDGWIPNSAVEHVRRLLVVDPASTVVLNPDDPNDVQRIAENRQWTHWQAEQWIRSLLLPSTPPEPNGLGAVVEASHSEIAGYGVFDGESWCFRYGAGADHSLPPGSLDIVTVVQHGVGCSCGAPDCPGGAS